MVPFPSLASLAQGGLPARVRSGCFSFWCQAIPLVPHVYLSTSFKRANVRKKMNQIRLISHFLSRTPLENSHHDQWHDQ